MRYAKFCCGVNNRPRGYITFFMHNSAEHGICPANKFQITNNFFGMRIFNATRHPRHIFYHENVCCVHSLESPHPFYLRVNHSARSGGKWDKKLFGASLYSFWVRQLTCYFHIHVKWPILMFVRRRPFFFFFFFFFFFS